LAGLVSSALLAVCGSSVATVNVHSYYTFAGTNGFAPSDLSQYSLTQEQDNVSPGAAQVQADWSGPNTGGSTNTWRFQGSAQMNSTTAITPNTLNLNAAGTFSETVTIFSGFQHPGGFAPGSAADYYCDFDIDLPASYTCTATLQYHGNVSLSSFPSTTVFFGVNNFETPKPVSFSGTIPAGHYSIDANASLAISGDVTAHFEGGISNFNFALTELPEPSGVCLLLFPFLVACSRVGRASYRII